MEIPCWDCFKISKRGQQPTPTSGACPHCSKENVSAKGDYCVFRLLLQYLRNNQKKQSKDSKERSWKKKKSKCTPKHTEQSYQLAESFQEMGEQGSKSKKKSGMQ